MNLTAFNSVLSFLSNFFTRPPHPWSIPLPPVSHKTFKSQFLDQFDEILIIGDVHGCFYEMMECFAQLNQKSNVLKIFVGDLVNKGEHSKQVLEYLRNEGKKNCFAVRGNHDEVVIRNYLNFKKNPSSLKSTDYWMKELSSEDINYLISLPYTITLKPLNIIIVHAGLVPGLSLKKQQPLDMVNMRNLVSNSACNGFIALKDEKEGEPWAKFWSGPEHIYFGHDAKRLLQKWPYATGLDTGCVYGRRLTAVFVKGPRKGLYLSVDSKKVYQIINN